MSISTVIVAINARFLDYEQEIYPEYEGLLYNG